MRRMAEARACRIGWTAALIAACIIAAPAPVAGTPVLKVSVAPEAEDAIVLAIGDSVRLMPHMQLRPRLLLHEGRDFRPGGFYAAVHQRSRLGLEAALWGWLSVSLEMQDVRVWGEETDTLADDNAEGFDLHQAWVELRCPLGLFVKVGRQEVSFDNERLIGSVGWSDAGRALDSLRLGYRSPGLEGDLLYAAVLDGDAFVGGASGATGGDQHLVALRARMARMSAFRPTLITLYDYQEIREQHRATLGLFFDGEPLPGFTYSGELYYQLGRQTVANVERELGALLGAVRAGYTLPERFLSLGISGWFEYLSGDDDSSDETVHTFDTLYATNHKFYGFMDYFTNIPVHTAGLGLMDMGGRLQLRPWSRLLIFIDFHHFEQSKKDPTYGTTTIGDEIDLLARLTVNRYLSLEMTTALFVPRLGASLLRRDAKSGQYGDQAEGFGYLQLDFAF